MDYCNSVLHGTSAKNLDRLQRVQNSLARCVCRAKWSDSATALRKSLHWLPIRARMKYKLAVVTCNARHSGGPACLSELIRDEVKCRTLRSSGPAKLHNTTIISGFWLVVVLLHRTNHLEHLEDLEVCSLNIDEHVLLLGSLNNF